MGATDSSPNTSGASGQLFGDTLRQLRRASGLTQAELAELLMESGALADSTRVMERSLKAAEEYGGPDALSYGGL